MAITVLTGSTTYRLDRQGKVYLFTVAIASATLVPTRVEMALATTYDISNEMVDLAGFSTGRESQQVPRWGSTGFPSSLTGGKTVEACSITLYADREGDDIRAVLDEADAVDVMILPAGDVPTAKAEVWRCEVNSITQVKSPTTGPGTVVVQFDVQNANQRVTIPA